MVVSRPRKPLMTKKRYRELDKMRLFSREEFENISNDEQKDFWKATVYYDMFPYMIKHGVRYTESGEY